MRGCALRRLQSFSPVFNPCDMSLRETAKYQQYFYDVLMFTLAVIL